MKATNKAQQQAAELALRAKRRRIDSAQLTGTAREMFLGMKQDELKELVETDVTNLPDKAEEE